MAVELVQSVGPEKMFPCAHSVSAPCPPDMPTHSPARSGFAPNGRLQDVAPGILILAEVELRQIVARGALSNDVT